MTYPVALTRRRLLQGSVAGSLALAGYAHPALAQAAKPMRIFSSGEHAKILSVAFSPDGRTIVSGSSSAGFSGGSIIYGSIIFWDASTGQRLRTAESTSSLDIYSVAFSPDGATVLSGGRLAAKVDLWNVGNGRHLRTFKEPGSELSHEQAGEIRSVAFSPDGRSALTAADEINLWDVATGSLIRTFGEDARPFRSIAFSPDGRTALSGGFNDDALILWDLATGDELRTFKTSSYKAMSVAFSPGGRTALSGGFSGVYVSRLTLWDVATGGLIRTFGGDSAGHATTVNSVAFSPDGRTALSGGGGPGEWLERDKTLRLWEVATGKVLRTFEGHPDSINSVAFSPDGRTALAASGNEIWQWDLYRR
jgi:WD40 repeat protein